MCCELANQKLADALRAAAENDKARFHAAMADLGAWLGAGNPAPRCTADVMGQTRQAVHGDPGFRMVPRTWMGTNNPHGDEFVIMSSDPNDQAQGFKFVWYRRGSRVAEYALPQ